MGYETADSPVKGIYEANVDGFLYYKVSSVMLTAFAFLSVCVYISIPFYNPLKKYLKYYRNVPLFSEEAMEVSAAVRS